MEFAPDANVYGEATGTVSDDCPNEGRYDDVQGEKNKEGSQHREDSSHNGKDSNKHRDKTSQHRMDVD